MSERLTEEELQEIEGGRWREGHPPKTFFQMAQAYRRLLAENAALHTRAEQAEQEVEAWRPYEYDKELRTLVPEKCLGWLETLRAERDALRTRAEQAEGERDNLQFEMQGLDFVRWKDNAYLIAQRDALRADLQEARGLLEDLSESYKESEVENAALRTRAEQAERELEQIPGLLKPIKAKADDSAQKLAEALPRLEALLAERDALRAEAVELLKAAEWLSHDALDRWKAMERVVEMVAKVEPVYATDYDGRRWACFGCNVEAPDDWTSFPHAEGCWWRQARAILDRTVTREVGETR